MTDRLASNQIVSERYEIIDLIGEGGMGLVYRVKQIYLSKEFALKTIKKAALSDLVVRRFQQEARAAFALKHENIISVNDFGILSDDTPFLVMELISGETLGQRIKRSGRLPLEEALPIFIQVCNGLDFAHKHGVVHRDVKPNNIMLVQDGSLRKTPVVKIVDFGIAKFAGHEEGEIQALTRTGEVFGSPFYMSPEQCLGGRIDNRSDIYSLGCVFFEALTGLPPFVGENALSTMMKHKGESHATLAEASLGLKFPRSLEEIVNSMLAKDPAERYENLDLVSADLQSLQGGNKISRSRQAPATVAGAAQDNQMIFMTKTKFYLLLAAFGVTSLSLATALFLALQPHKQLQEPNLNQNETTIVTRTAVGKATGSNKPAAIESEGDAVDNFRPLPDEELDRRFLHPVKGHPVELNVAVRDITDHVLERISQCETMRRLMFTDCKIETAGLVNLANMKSLREIGFSGSNVDDTSVKYLSACKKLSILNINATKITDKGLTVINKIPSLSKLSASALKITNAGVSAPNPGLVYLELKHDHNISNAALTALAALKLEGLEIDDTHVDDDGMKALTRIKSLIQISLIDTRVTLTGLRMLYDNLPKLTRLDVSINSTLTEDDIKQLKSETAPRTKIVVHKLAELEVR